MVNLDRMMKNFLLNEGSGPSTISYIQALSEVLSSMTPHTVTDMRRLEVARENVLNLKRHVRRMEEKIGLLETELTELRILQEIKTKED